IIIRTDGPFRYDLTKDFAIFEVSSKSSPSAPEPVKVFRTPQPETNPHVHDQLFCERLETQFRRKKPVESKPGANDARSVDLEIDTARATGNGVVLVSDAEVLEIVNANEFFYEAQKRQTTIKGSHEIVVLKEAHELKARELYIEDQPGGGQRMTALGPGTV